MVNNRTENWYEIRADFENNSHDCDSTNSGLVIMDHHVCERLRFMHPRLPTIRLAVLQYVLSTNIVRSMIKRRVSL